MNWLETHLETFVKPALCKLLNKKINFDAVRLPSKFSGFYEAVQLAKAIQQHSMVNYSKDIEYLLKAHDTGFISGMFGKRYVSEIVGIPVTTSLVCHSFVKTTLRSLDAYAKASGKTLILTGRDMWMWNVLAKKMNIKIIYDPIISREVAADYTTLREIVNVWDVDLDKCILFDTGWNGTIWKHICSMSGKKPVNLMLSAESVDEFQIFKNMSRQTPKAGATYHIPERESTAREIAYKIEDTPKYWTSGAVSTKNVNDRRVRVANQGFASPDEFIRATALTIWAWHVQSPNFIHTSAYAGKMKKSKLAFGKVQRGSVLSVFFADLKTDSKIVLAKISQYYKKNGCCPLCKAGFVCAANCNQCHHGFSKYGEQNLKYAIDKLKEFFVINPSDKRLVALANLLFIKKGSKNAS